jgi:GAF domain-containing protein
LNATSQIAARRELRTEDLSGLAEALRTADRPPRIYAAIEVLSGEIIGHRLFTIMRFDADRQEVERVHSSLPSVYPVGGRKKKANTAWADHTLHAMKVFRAVRLDQIRAAFDDHATIARLGLGSILNVPIVFAGRCTGTMNLLHEAGWYTARDETLGALLGAFLPAPLIEAASQAS